MTLPTEPITWAESSNPGDVTEPSSGVRDSGYQFEDELPHDEFNAVVRGIYRWLKHQRDSGGVQNFTQFFSHEEFTGRIWEASVQPTKLGGRTDNSATLPKDTPSVMGITRCRDRFYTVEYDGTNTLLGNYPVDGDQCVEDKAAYATLSGFPAATDSTPIASSDSWVCVARGSTALFIEVATGTTKTLVRTDGRLFKDAAFRLGLDVVLAANEKIERYFLPTFPASGDETDAVLAFDFDSGDDTKDVKALACLDELIIASGDARTDGTHVGIFTSNGTASGGWVVTDGTYTISQVGGMALRVDNQGLLSLLAFDSVADVTMVKTARIAVAPDSLINYSLIPLNTETFAGPSVGFDMDGHYVYVGGVDTNYVFVFNKHDMSLVLKSPFQVASLTDIFSLCGADTKFFVGKAKSAAHPSAYIKHTGIGPVEYLKRGRLPYSAAAT